VVNGHARLDDINEMLGTQLAAEGLDTIGGFIFNRLGTLPKPGTELQVDDLTLQVRRISRKRIEEVAITQPCEPGDDEEVEEAAP
jgi:CBS domain containing-hemolysin-like protein